MAGQDEPKPNIFSLTDRLQGIPGADLQAAAQQHALAIAEQEAARLEEKRIKEIGANYFQTIFGFIPSHDTDIEMDGLSTENPYTHQLFELKRASTSKPSKLYSADLPVDGAKDNIQAVVYESQVVIPSAITDVAEIVICRYSLEEQSVYDIFTRKSDGTWLRNQLTSEDDSSFQPTEEVNQPTEPFIDAFKGIKQHVVACENPYAKARRKYAELEEYYRSNYSGEELDEKLQTLQPRYDHNERFARLFSGYPIEIDRYHVGVGTTLPITPAPLFN